jgi:hypothetical protein
MATATVDRYVILSPNQLPSYGGSDPKDISAISAITSESVQHPVEDHSANWNGAEPIVGDNDNRPQEETGSLISASLITDNFDALRFDAAASLQVLQSRTPLTPPTSRSHHLISSPYNDPDHLLDLRTLDAQCRLLAQALTFLRPITPDYAAADYLTSFNWAEVLSVLRILAADEGHEWISQSFYAVIFRSQLNKGIDQQRLHDLDKTSHREAVVSGGLLKYWFGQRDEDERNLATCATPEP